MNDYIINDAKNVLKAGLEHFSNELKVQPKDVQIVIYTDNKDCTPKYKLYKIVDGQMKFEKYLEFLDILNVKVDFMGKETTFKPFLIDNLQTLSQLYQCEPQEISLMCYLRGETLDFTIYKGVEEMQKFTLDGEVGESIETKESVTTI